VQFSTFDGYAFIEMFVLMSYDFMLSCGTLLIFISLFVVSVLLICFIYYAGYDVYLVGGCVRDLIMKKTPKDFDIITTADLRQVITQMKCVLS
jgi:hypothetical protein